MVTEWEVFRALDLGRLRSVLRQPIVIDLRNIYPPGEMHAEGFVYRSIGRGTEVSDDSNVARLHAHDGRDKLVEGA
jgi:hypothetical protein